MKKSILILLTAILFIQCKSDDTEPENQNMVKETITFMSSEDELTITADTYLKASNSEFILLCHQAGFSRGEYNDTAPKFVEKGYNCMAIDQRSGNEINGVINQTHVEAVEQALTTNYLSARPDIIAAIDKAYALNGNKPIYLLGSSYSSSWALLLGKTNAKVKAVIAFSPRENLSGINITNELTGYAKPIFVTSSLTEIATTVNLVINIEAQYLTHFQSIRPGIHGARCLWESTDGQEAYWTALETFLDTTN